MKQRIIMNRKRTKKQAGEETAVWGSIGIPFTFHPDDTGFIILIIQYVSKICDWLQVFLSLTLHKK